MRTPWFRWVAISFQPLSILRYHSRIAATFHQMGVSSPQAEERGTVPQSLGKAKKVGSLQQFQFKELQPTEKSRFSKTSGPIIHKVSHNSVENEGPKTAIRPFAAAYLPDSRFVANFFVDNNYAACWSLEFTNAGLSLLVFTPVRLSHTEKSC